MRKLYFFVFILFIQNFSSTSQEVKIGVALPLFEDSGDSKGALGNEILDGMKFALGEYNKTASLKISLDVRDTKRDMTVTQTIFTDFGEDSSISCVIGPVFSTELDAVSQDGGVYNMPVISPTATGDNLASSHTYIYQMNPSYEVRGKLMADYLTKEIGLKNFAVIYEDSYGENFRKHFEDEVKKTGGKIVFSKSYSKDSKNITPVVDSINSLIKTNDLFINIANLNLVQREKLEKAGVRTLLLDSLMNNKTEVSIYYLFGKNAKKIIDTLNIKPYQLKQTSPDYIQGYIDAIYIPVSSPDEISMLVPELFSNGLSFFIAGTGDWNNEKTLEDNKVYLKNLYFESEYYVNDEDSAVKELVTKLKKSKYKLSKNFLFGYDAVALLSSIIAKGNISRSQINGALQNISGYKAIKSLISLDYHGVNSELNILTYNNGLKKIMDYKLKK